MIRNYLGNPYIRQLLGNQQTHTHTHSHIPVALFSIARCALLVVPRIAPSYHHRSALNTDAHTGAIAYRYRANARGAINHPANRASERGCGKRAARTWKKKNKSEKKERGRENARPLLKCITLPLATISPHRAPRFMCQHHIRCVSLLRASRVFFTPHAKIIVRRNFRACRAAGRSFAALLRMMKIVRGEWCTDSRWHGPPRAQFSYYAGWLNESNFCRHLFYRLYVARTDFLFRAARGRFLGVTCIENRDV